ncbi:helix-turn-helix domain-containing protein [Sphingobacterium sp. ML3W]|uniref:helix-turn-helix domain-containing protein n=1 Tax=Sphingobacterium sp. ML3W TaxID=1538644 RepID=UPI0038515BFC
MTIEKYLQHRAPVQANDQIIWSFINLVEQYYIQHKSIKFYTDQLNISPRKLNDIIENYFGLSPSKIIHKFLEIEIKKELTTTDKPLKELCYSFGFNKPSTFTKYVKNITGVTPSRYRALNAVLPTTKHKTKILF